MQSMPTILAASRFSLIAFWALGVCHFSGCDQPTDQGSTPSADLSKNTDGEPKGVERRDNAATLKASPWIIARVAGQVDAIETKAGEQVEFGDVLVVLVNPELQQAAVDAAIRYAQKEAEFNDLKVRLESQRLKAEANIAKVRTNRDAAELQAEADNKHFRDGLIPEIQRKKSQLVASQKQAQFVQLENRFKKLCESIEAQLRSNQATLDQIILEHNQRQRELALIQIRAPATGTVLEIAVEKGQRLKPGENILKFKFGS